MELPKIVSYFKQSNKTHGLTVYNDPQGLLVTDQYCAVRIPCQMVDRTPFWRADLPGLPPYFIPPKGMKQGPLRDLRALGGLYPSWVQWASPGASYSSVLNYHPSPDLHENSKGVLMRRFDPGFAHDRKNPDDTRVPLYLPQVQLDMLAPNTGVLASRYLYNLQGSVLKAFDLKDSSRLVFVSSYTLGGDE